jgi:hypothetical protein
LKGRKERLASTGAKGKKRRRKRFATKEDDWKRALTEGGRSHSWVG